MLVVTVVVTVVMVVVVVVVVVEVVEFQRSVWLEQTKSGISLERVSPEKCAAQKLEFLEVNKSKRL